MSADVASEPLSKVDSASHVEPSSPTDKKISHRRTSSTVSGVFNINDLEKEKVDISIAPETQKLGWKLNTSPTSLDDKEVLKKLLCTPPVKRIDLHFPLGLEVTARNMRGVTIKDALDAIYKQFKKKADDELDAPYLAGFEWDRDECYTRFIVHQKKTGEAPAPSSKKNKKKAGDE
ncbi:hypothetical protein K461DRAFT_275952 [Myriangium duriaei CBS 260.36]|uniref:DUF6699 domain-containing protein n=1 Tax=Myriangium duriaei CBS 260.36 TaxID=1168546 RepID=A0A9P4J4R6_9PEZI|nr:hypothetical protein K461DRAFT_275952 [Myriangium duriaei CBS 260.36]